MRNPGLKLVVDPEQWTYVILTHAVEAKPISAVLVTSLIGYEVNYCDSSYLKHAERLSTAYSRGRTWYDLN